MPYFLVSYTYGPRVPNHEELRQPHRDWIASLGETLVIGGVHEGHGGTLVFEAADSDTVEALVARDPFVSGRVVVEHPVRPWRPALGRLAHHF